MLHSEPIPSCATQEGIGLHCSLLFLQEQPQPNISSAVTSRSNYGSTTSKSKPFSALTRDGMAAGSVT